MLVVFVDLVMIVWTEDLSFYLTVMGWFSPPNGDMLNL